MWSAPSAMANSLWDRLVVLDDVDDVRVIPDALRRKGLAANNHSVDGVVGQPDELLRTYDLALDVFGCDDFGRLRGRRADDPQQGASGNVNRPVCTHHAA